MPLRIKVGGNLYLVPRDREVDVEKWIGEQTWAGEYEAELQAGRAEAERQRVAAADAERAKAADAAKAVTPAARAAARKVIKE